MIRSLPVLLLLLSLTHCANVDPGPPPVDVERMSRIIAELNLAQSLTGQVPIVVRDSVQAAYFDAVLADYDLTRPEFDSIMWLIRTEPTWIDTLYSRAGEIVARDMVEEGE